LQALVAAVDRLASAPQNRSHAELAEALRATSAAVRELGSGAVARADRIDQLATELDTPGDQRRDHSESLAAALAEALGAIQDTQRDPVDGANRDAFVAAVAAAGAVDREQPLLAQQARVHLALVAVTNALATARGVKAPFTAAASTVEHRPDLDAFVKHTTRASELASAAATAEGWTPARQKTAETLHALADAVSRAPAASPELGAQAMLIRFEAIRLQRAEVIDQRRVDWAKAGLLGTVAALESMRVDASPVLASLVRSARTSVEAIDVNWPFAFQRAAIQDGMRAVVGAYGAIAVSEQAARRQAVR
jgi:hypothetical protein